MPARKPPSAPIKPAAQRKAGRRSLASRPLRLAKRCGALLARRPAAAGSFATVALLFASIAGNAFYAQPGRHPKPFLATRAGDLFGGESLAAANDETLMAVPLVREVQAELARAGHYRAAVDGRPGRATQAAIEAFQKEHGLKPTGEPSPLLLTQIRQMTARAPVPAAPERFAAVEPRQSEGQGELEAGKAPRVTAASAPPAAAATMVDSQLVRQIQAGLSTAQVAELEPDGILGERTRAAIRTFEALEGLEVTGVPQQLIVERLIAIGALE